MQYKIDIINQWINIKVDLGSLLASKVKKITTPHKKAKVKQKGVALTSGRMVKSKEFIIGEE